MAGYNSRPVLVKPPKERKSLIDTIIGEIKVNLGLNNIYSIPEYKYKK